MLKLKQLHPGLYQRVRLKGLTYTGLGLGLIVAEHTPSRLTVENLDRSGVERLLSYDILGAIFIIIGVGILYGLSQGFSKHYLSRFWLKVAFAYAMFWEVVLLLTIILVSPRSLSVMVLWTYLTYNLWYVAHDPGWEGAEILKEMQNNEQRS